MLKNEDFMNENIDLKKLFICLKQKLVLMLVITILGALFCGAIYIVARETTKPTYQSFSKFYIQFIFDPSGDVIQAYNGYTWNDILHSDPVLDHVVAAMPDSSILSSEVLKEQLRDNVFKGEILSDLRLLTVTYTTDNPEWTKDIQQAMEIGLINFADNQREISSMELIRSSDVKRVIWDDNLHRAIIGGAVLFLLVNLFCWWIWYILDDSLYTISDAEKRYPLPVVGILTEGESVTTENFYFSEIKENLAYLLKGKTERLYLTVGKLPYPSGDELRKADAIILLIPFGNRNGKEIDRCFSYLKNQDTEATALLITDANVKFLKDYYGGHKKI